MVVAYIEDAVVLAGVYTLFSIGLSLAWGVLDVLNLAHGAIFMSAAVVAYVLTMHTSLPLPLLVLVGGIVSGVLALLLEIGAFEPLRRRSENARSAELGIVIASVVAGAALEAIAQHETSGNTVAIKTTFVVHTFDLGGLLITNLDIVIVGVAIGLTVLVAWIAARTSLGRSMRALAVDPYICGLLGISTTFVSRLTLCISGFLAGTAGVLLGVYVNGVSAGMGDQLLLKAFAIVVLGGVGSIWGAALGALLLASTETIAVALGAAPYSDAIAFVIILFLLMVRPRGLFPTPSWQRT